MNTEALIKRYGFAAAVVGALALMTLLVAGKEVVGLVAGGDKPAGAQGGGGPAPFVQTQVVQTYTFTDAIQALGTAQARESLTITSKVSDVIRVIRFDSGDRVGKGQVLVELASVEQQADLNEARAQLDVDKRAYDRFQELGDKGFATRARMDEAEAAYLASKARVDGLQARINERVIRAPFAGVIGLRTASPGLLATPGEPIATLDDITIIKLDFDVPEPQLGRLKKGQAIVAKTAAFPDDAFEGVIDDIDSRVNTTTRTVRVRAMLPNKKERIKPGMLMTVEVRSNPRPAPAIPEMALTEEAGGAFVYRIDAEKGEQVAAKVVVKTGTRRDGMIEIAEGLQPGDRVIVEGVQRVRPGQPVRLSETETASGGAAIRGRK